MLKSKKENAAIALGNHMATAGATTLASSARSSETLASTPMVDTIASLAVKPERDAATGCHSPKPSGAKIGANTPPITANRLCPLSTMPKLPSSAKPKPPKNHMTTQARNKIVPALMMKPFRRSHTCMSTVFTLGIWYCGSSMTKGAGLPENGFVFFKMIAATSTATMPRKYMSGATRPPAS